jgi:hypothetical protein
MKSRTFQVKLETSKKEEEIQFINHSLKEIGFYQITMAEGSYIMADGLMRKILVTYWDSPIQKSRVLSRPEIKTFLKHARDIQREPWIATVKPLHNSNGTTNRIDWINLDELTMDSK